MYGFFGQMWNEIILTQSNALLCRKVEMQGTNEISWNFQSATYRDPHKHETGRLRFTLDWGQDWPWNLSALCPYWFCSDSLLTAYFAQIVRSCHSSEGYLLAFHHGQPVQDMWDLWWAKWHWGRFSASTEVSLATHSTDCSTLIIIHHQRLV
jgi:hypothetical protein